MKSSKELFNKVARKYESSVAFKLAITAIPKIGGILDILLSTRANELSNNRIEALIQSLSRKLEQIEANKIRMSFLDSEEFYNLLVQAANATIKTKNIIKIQAYASILASSITVECNEQFTYEDYLNILISLTEKELIFVKAIYDEVKNPFDYKMISEGFLLQLIERENLPKAYPNFIICRLQSMGLITEFKASVIGYGGGVYEITLAFRELMEAINLYVA
ncbi:hypothetical protein QMN03_17135 [Leptospira santarosai]|uniref:hypothetical protein n=1 Tax=Leptospira santarosai TaxID=28183 RepID=UPI0024AF1F5E|nr:hypothetical protein [Leptospira santarosai]MDI7208594.1 hypothetical protein [Leptospira santarosai]